MNTNAAMYPGHLGPTRWSELISRFLTEHGEGPTPGEALFNLDNLQPLEAFLEKRPQFDENQLRHTRENLY
ncbi:hypothetical protein BOW52_10710 [Solemya elarraichensis gill symbiont]|uniref:Uncharacterized protein n=1 Tax=Solemya elarraichensis gill symbiont TaxID=1918949 RepID=A0A1T2KUL8_9GAMM|nr:hypothetical protein BOW52_10710 [Solemya elarraichensis gill symbiont]